MDLIGVQTWIGRGINTHGATLASWEMGLHKQILSSPTPHGDNLEVHSIQLFRGSVAGLRPSCPQRISSTVHP